MPYELVRDNDILILLLDNNVILRIGDYQPNDKTSIIVRFTYYIQTYLDPLIEYKLTINNKIYNQLLNRDNNDIKDKLIEIYENNMVKLVHIKTKTLSKLWMFSEHDYD